MTRMAPDELIEVLRQMGERGIDNGTIAERLASVLEDDAKSVLTEWGYGIEQYTLESNSQEFIAREWYNEAGHIQGCGDLELEQAGLIILEHTELKHHMLGGETEKATLSLAKIIAAGLLFNDYDRQRKEKEVSYQLLSCKAELAIAQQVITENKVLDSRGGSIGVSSKGMHDAKMKKSASFKRAIEQCVEPLLDRGIMHNVAAKHAYEAQLTSDYDGTLLPMEREKKWVLTIVAGFYRKKGRTDLVLGATKKK